MKYFGYILKPIFAEIFVTNFGYFLIAGHYFTFFLPFFFISRSAIILAWKALSKLRKITNFDFAILNLKGIGYKAYYFIKDHSIYLSVGYNHMCRYILSSSSFSKVRKHHMVVYSLPLVISIKFASYEIQYIRFPDPYRGKGIVLENQSLSLKPGKQR